MEERIVELETRLAFQEDAIHHLNETVAAQQRQIDSLNGMVDLLRQRLQQISTSPLQGHEEESPPPHY
jgi:SlyX protein